MPRLPRPQGGRSPDGNPYAADDHRDPEVRFEQAERLAAIRACRVALVAVAPVLAGAGAAERAMLAWHRLALRGGAALVAMAAVTWLALAWYRVGHRCRPVAGRAARLGILIQLLIHGALLAFLVIRQVGAGR